MTITFDPIQLPNLDISIKLDVSEDPENPLNLLLKPTITATHPQDAEGGRHVVFMLDRSGSMKGPRWEALTKSVAKILETLDPSKDRASVMLFEDKIQTVANKSPDFAQIKHAIDQNPPVEGPTNIKGAIEALTPELIGNSSATTVMFFTDGIATSDGINFDKFGLAIDPTALMAKRRQKFKEAKSHFPPSISVGCYKPAVDVLEGISRPFPFYYSGDADGILAKMDEASQFVGYSYPIDMGVVLDTRKHVTNTKAKAFSKSFGDFGYITNKDPLSPPAVSVSKAYLSGGFSPYFQLGNKVCVIKPEDVLREGASDQKETKQTDGSIIDLSALLVEYKAILAGIQNNKPALVRLNALRNKLPQNVVGPQAIPLQDLRNQIEESISKVSNSAMTAQEVLEASALLSQTNYRARTGILARQLEKKKTELAEGGLEFNNRERSLTETKSGKQYFIVSHDFNLVDVVTEEKTSDLSPTHPLSYKKGTPIAFVDPYSNDFITIDPQDNDGMNAALGCIPTTGNDQLLVDRVASPEYLKQILKGGVDHSPQPALVSLAIFLKTNYLKNDLPDIATPISFCRQYAALLAYLLAKKESLKSPEKRAEIFVYRATADNLKAHAWVIKKQGSQVFLLDATNAKDERIFEISKPKQLKQAISYYKQRGLPGILRNLCAELNKPSLQNNEQEQKKSINQQLPFHHDSLIKLPNIPELSQQQKDYFQGKGWICPLSRLPINEPVVLYGQGFTAPFLCDKQSFELDQLINGHTGINPFTKEPLSSYGLEPQPQVAEEMFKILTDWFPTAEQAVSADDASVKREAIKLEQGKTAGIRQREEEEIELTNLVRLRPQGSLDLEDVVGSFVTSSTTHPICTVTDRNTDKPKDDSPTKQSFCTYAGLFFSHPAGQLASFAVVEGVSLGLAYWIASSLGDLDKVNDFMSTTPWEKAVSGTSVYGGAFVLAALLVIGYQYYQCYKNRANNAKESDIGQTKLKTQADSHEDTLPLLLESTT